MKSVSPDAANTVFARSSVSEKEINRAAVELGTWYMGREKGKYRLGQDEDEDHAVTLHRVNATFQAYGPDVVKIHHWFSDLEPYEREVLDDLRDIGVSIPDIVDYLRAPEDLNPEGKTIRSDMASSLRLQHFEEKSQKIKSSGRSAAILAGSALVLIAGAAVAAPTVLPAIAPSLAPAVTTALAPVAAYLPTLQSGAMSLLHLAAGGGAMAIAVKSWNNWQKIRGGPPALNIGKQEDFKDLPNSLGNLDYKRITDEYQAIPAADRYLLAHLSESEMRLFLSGSDSVRKHILSASPPSAWSKIQSRLDSLAKGKRTFPARVRRLGQVAYTILTASWNRESGNGRIPDLEKRMERWRAAARINTMGRQEDLALASSQQEDTHQKEIISLIPKTPTMPRDLHPYWARVQSSLIANPEDGSKRVPRAQINLGAFASLTSMDQYRSVKKKDTDLGPK